MFGEAVVSLKDMVKLAGNQEITYNLYEEGKKSKSSKRGILMVRNCTLRKFYSFLDLHVKNGLNIVPVIAVDFS